MDERAICARCGFTWVINKNKRPKPRQLCRSCRTKKSYSIQTGELRCFPWDGAFAADWITPIDEEGKPVLPGKRVCGNTDCVNISHIEKEE